MTVEHLRPEHPVSSKGIEVVRRIRTGTGGKQTSTQQRTAWTLGEIRSAFGHRRAAAAVFSEAPSVTDLQFKAADFTLRKGFKS